MRKKIFFIFILFFILSEFYAYDFNLDLQAQFFYNNYIKNDTFNYLAQQMTLTAFDYIQKTRIKIKEKKEQLKFDFDTRLYLKTGEDNFEYFIDSLYFSFENGPFVLYAGKQRIKWGVGYTWNPTDKLQPGKNILDPKIDLEGFYALRIEYSNDFITPSVIIAPQIKSIDSNVVENIRFAMQLYKLIGNADFFINGIYQMNNIQTIGMCVSYDINLFILNIESAAVRFMEPSLWITRMTGIDNDGVKYSYLIGINKIFTSSFFMSLEYYYNGWGFENLKFNDYINLNINKVSEFGFKKNYASFNISYTWDEKILTKITCIYGIDDSCFLFYPGIEYIENQDFNIELGFVENITDKNKETYYSMPFFNSLVLKLKAYF